MRGELGVESMKILNLIFSAERLNAGTPYLVHLAVRWSHPHQRDWMPTGPPDLHRRAAALWAVVPPSPAHVTRKKKRSDVYLRINTCASSIRGTIGWWDKNMFSQQRDTTPDLHSQRLLRRQTSVGITTTLCVRAPSRSDDRPWTRSSPTLD